MRIITSKTIPVKSEFPFIEKSNDGINYLWKLENPETVNGLFAGFDIFKDGFAKRVYKGGFDGVESRLKNTLADMELKLGLHRGVLKARIIRRKDGTYDEALSAEQYFQKVNKKSKIQILLHAKSKNAYKINTDENGNQSVGLDYRKTIGGSSEFVIMPMKKAVAKFANAWRKANRKIGMKVVTWKRENGVRGCPVGFSGKNDEEPSK
tara:strand:- start:28 stop:651 length:624 start_codon:yes stop_codon:yes gene_type:complete